MNLNNGDIQLMHFKHVGCVVKDAEKAIEALSFIWNLGQPETVIYEPKQDEMIFGEAFKLKLVFVKFGPVELEFLEPMSDGSVWADFIAEKGEGIQHVAYGVSNYDEVVKKIEAQNNRLLASASRNGERWCYYEMNPGGMIFEFCEEYMK